MDVLFDRYPVYEANQVLTSGHLNDGFDYGDEQTRLTRSTLIGIGIVCGLEITLDTSAGVAIRVSKGCGVTSEGYLIIESQDVSLVASRSYTLPSDIGYAPFKAAGDTQFQLWELFPAGEPKTTPLDADAHFLDDKAVLLFLELKKQGLRNCSPNNCDDKGAEVTATVRRLLIATADLDQIIAAENALGSGLTASDLDTALSAKLNLPDIHVRRFDVVSTGPATANEVYAAFLNVFRAVQLAKATGDALNAAYAAFKPVLQTAYPANPFSTFGSQFNFLDSAPTSAPQVRFLQYYVGLFEDIARAYDEFRWKGVELLCTCCPPDGLFPRHLMLGLLHPEVSTQSSHYRQAFLPSPAVGSCVAESKTLLDLFARLVEMAARFTNTPALPSANNSARIDPQIRVTPSVLGEDPLAARAIPYYYQQNGTPPLYRLWSSEKTRRNRANQNLSYRYDEYSPAAPAFVSDPLRYDLEAYNFLRVEGHLGKDYQHVLSSLLSLKSQYRLPVDIIALRAGTYDDTQPVDLSKETARFQDLEALYDSLREELLSSFAQAAMDFYDIPVDGSTLSGGAPQLPLLKNYMPNYRYPAGSVGAFYEQHLQTLQAVPYIDVDQRLMSDPNFVGQVLRVYCILFAGAPGLPGPNYPDVVSVFYFSKLAEILPGTLDALGYADFENKYQDLLALVRYFRSQVAVPPDLQHFAPQAELIDDFNAVLLGCKLDAIKSVHLEYVRRLGELKKRQFLSNFLLQHPGIQHKAGVPLGGTFIVVYHDLPQAPLPPTNVGIINTALFAEAFAREARLSSRLVDNLAGPQVVDRPLSNVTPAMFAPTPGASLASTPTASPAETPAATLAAASTATLAPDVSIAQVADALKGTNLKALQLTDAISRIGSDKVLTQNPDISFVLGALTGRIPIVQGRVPPGLDDRATRIITTTVNGLVDGTVIADFFLPYRISSDVPGAQYVLPKIPPSVTAKAACTGADGFASVTIDVKGGEPPYDIAVDDAGYQAMTGNTIALKAGVHALKIRDSAGLEGGVQSISIPGAISIGAPQFNCQNSQYTATFGISGGTPPYAVNGDPVPGDGTTFTTDAVASGTSVTVEVRDNVGCSMSTTFTHECPPPCDLPCAGISLRRGYRMWLPDPDPNNPYTDSSVDTLAFSVDSVQGQPPIDLTGKIRPILAKQGDLSPTGFPDLVRTWLSRINSVINGAPGLNRAGQVSWLTLSYESNGPGRLGTLWLEYFGCLSFDIRIAATFRRRRDSGSLRVTYEPDGTSILMNDRTTTVPAFEGTRIDKCNPNTPVEAICGGAQQLKLKISKTSQQGLTVTLGVTAEPPTDRFVWEALNGNPAMGNGPAFTTAFQDGTTVGSVVVTAYTKAGCVTTQTAQIQLSGTPPPIGTLPPIVTLPPIGTLPPIVTIPPLGTTPPLGTIPPIATPPIATPPIATVPIATQPVAIPPIATVPIATPAVAIPPIATVPIATPAVTAPPITAPPIATSPIGIVRPSAIVPSIASTPTPPPKSSPTPKSRPKKKKPGK